MPIPNAITRTLDLPHPQEKVGAALTTLDGITGWFGSHAYGQIAPGRDLHGRWEQYDAEGTLAIKVVEPMTLFAFCWGISGAPEGDPRQTGLRRVRPRVDRARDPRLTVTESGFAQLPDEWLQPSYQGNVEGWREELRRAGGVPRCGLTRRRCRPVSSRRWPTPTGGPFLPRSPNTDRARPPTWSRRLAITRQGVTKHLALLAEAGLVTSDAGGGRRVLYRHRSEPIKVAQSYLAALAADWDGSLERLSMFLTDPPGRPPRESPQRGTCPACNPGLRDARRDGASPWTPRSDPSPEARRSTSAASRAGSDRQHHRSMRNAMFRTDPDAE